MPPATDSVRIAALGDLHYGRTAAQESLHALFAQISDEADILVLCGDLTDYGLPDEARALVRELAALKIPAVGVLGNHDYESGHQIELREIFAAAGLPLLDGYSIEILSIGFAGIKGFAGGFGRRALGPRGEQIVKNFVHDAVDEALKLESALARLRTDHLIAILHYAPVQGTVEGEPPEIFPFMGCSRLEDSLNRFPVTAVFHGHAHHGRPEARTSSDVPVYNVSMSLMRETFPDRPFRIVEINTAAGADERRTGSERREPARPIDRT